MNRGKRQLEFDVDVSLRYAHTNACEYFYVHVQGMDNIRNTISKMAIIMTAKHLLVIINKKHKDK